MTLDWWMAMAGGKGREAELNYGLAWFRIARGLSRFSGVN